MEQRISLITLGVASRPMFDAELFATAEKMADELVKKKAAG